MRLRHVLALVALASAGAAPTAHAAPPGTVPLPSSIAALGNSLTRAFGSGGPNSLDTPANSWATGGNPAVGSHYLRLLALNPAIAGNDFNDARSGGPLADTLDQAALAVSQGADYVTIESGTNDVCVPTVAEMTTPAAFATALRATLDRITTGLPEAQIFVLSIPDWVVLWDRYHDDPAAQTAWATYNDRCPDLLAASATMQDRHAIRDRIRDLNRVIAGVCATYPACSSDHDATYHLWPSLSPDDLSYDYFHLSASGQARLAAATWPLTPYAHATRRPAPPASAAGAAGASAAATGVHAGGRLERRVTNGRTAHARARDVAASRRVRVREHGLRGTFASGRRTDRATRSPDRCPSTTVQAYPDRAIARLAPKEVVEWSL